MPSEQPLGGPFDDIAKVRQLLSRVEQVDANGKTIQIGEGTLVHLGGGGFVFLPKPE